MIWTAGVLALLLSERVSADIYLHNPRGSNNKWCEKQQNTQNQNRLFDSQNNAAGGVHCAGDQTIPTGDPLVFYTGSRMSIEWTNQHGCGPLENTVCNTVIQAACSGDDMFPGLRDPVGSGPMVDAGNGGTEGQFFKNDFLFNNDQGTNRIPQPNQIPAEVGLPEDKDSPEYAQALRDFYRGNLNTPFGRAGAEYGLVEDWDYYDECSRRSRNKGLWTADQNMNGNRNSARSTRQDNNGAGNRYGFECPEERDYWPYHGATQFRDIAVLTSQVAHCEYYQRNSQNVSPRYKCVCDEECQQSGENRQVPITEAACRQSNGVWTEVPAHGILPPDCRAHPYTRDNHLGNAIPVDESDENMLESGQPEAAHYDWVVPEWMEGRQCIVRIRYNISTMDFMPNSFLSDEGVFTDSASNCDPNTEDQGGMREGENRPYCKNVITSTSVPLYNDPYVTNQPLDGSTTHELAIAMNTDQSARTFQDRSHVFRVAARPEEIPDSATIWNLNVRGRRGNIVQAYPVVEYDFVPNELTVKQGDYVALNVHNSWFNNENTAGNGNNAMDGTNLVEISNSAANFPVHYEAVDQFFDPETAVRLAFPPFYASPGSNSSYSECDLSCCQTYHQHEVVNDNNVNFDQQIYNCGKLNHMPPTWQPTFQVTAATGRMYSFASTRNNDFSNRSHKMRIFVESNLSAGAIAGIAIASVAVVGAAAGFGFYKFKNRAVSGNSAV